MSARRPIRALAVIVACLITSACTSTVPLTSTATLTSTPAPTQPTSSVTEYEVSGMLHIKDRQANVCAIQLQSNPPQCAGAIPVAGLDAFAIPPHLLESYRGVTWGDARLIGTYENGTLTLTRAPLPRRSPEPLPPVAVPTDPAPVSEDLMGIAEKIAARDDPRVLTVGTDLDGVHVLTPLDEDGELQASFDAEFGAGAVVVDSWLQPWSR